MWLLRHVLVLAYIEETPFPTLTSIFCHLIPLKTIQAGSLLHCILNHHFSVIYLNERLEQCVQLGFGSDDLAIFFSMET